MPYKRKYTKKRKTKRRPKRRSVMTMTSEVVPKSKVVRMRYGMFGTINAGAGTAAQWLFSCNSINDPDYSGTGHQPYGHDTWQTLYNTYTVLGSKINVHFLPTDATAKIGQVVASITVEDDTAISGNQSLAILERPGGTYGIMGNSNASSGLRLRKNFSTKGIFGLADVKDNITDVGAAFGSDPAKQAFFHCSVGSIDGSSDPAAIAITVVQDFIVLLTDRKELGES